MSATSRAARLQANHRKMAALMDQTIELYMMLDLDDRMRWYAEEHRFHESAVVAPPPRPGPPPEPGWHDRRKAQ